MLKSHKRLFVRLTTTILLFSLAATAAEQHYVMISGWGLYPDPASASLQTALSEIGKAHVSGIAYGTLGVEPRIRAKARLNADFDPNTYNRSLFALAKVRNANLWLQLRYYDNWIGNANLTAPGILSNPASAKTFLQSAMASVRTYAEAYPNACTIILGEEETLYHAKGGGGLFWAGQQLWDASAKLTGDQALRHSASLDEWFVDQYTGITRLLMQQIRSDYPHCRVGLHIGHEPLYQNIGDTPIYGVILRKLQPLVPDFTFYDLYEKISKTDADFRDKLIARVKLLKALGQPVYYLAQLHTTNAFGAGGGRTPSAGEIEETANLARQLGVDGFGYYTKNAIPTKCMESTAGQAGCNAREDRNPLDPNATGQNMVWQSSPRRWQFGLSKLAK